MVGKVSLVGDPFTPQNLFLFPIEVFVNLIEFVCLLFPSLGFDEQAALESILVEIETTISSMLLRVLFVFIGLLVLIVF